MKVEITFIEPLLGTLSGEPEIAKEFILANHPKGEQVDEAASLPDTIEKASSLFSKENGRPFLWDYQIKGFFKDACSMMMRVEKVKELTAYKKIIDGLIFVAPRKIFLTIPSESHLSWTERPLRAQTAQGERIALARSETAPIGTTIEIEIITLRPDLEKYVKNWLEYGRLRGIGQWRNSGCGRFDWKELKS